MMRKQSSKSATPKVRRSHQHRSSNGDRSTNDVAKASSIPKRRSSQCSPFQLSVNLTLKVQPTGGNGQHDVKPVELRLDDIPIWHPNESSSTISSASERSKSKVSKKKAQPTKNRYGNKQSLLRFSNLKKHVPVRYHGENQFTSRRQLSANTQMEEDLHYQNPNVTAELLSNRSRRQQQQGSAPTNERHNRQDPTAELLTKISRRLEQHVSAPTDECLHRQDSACESNLISQTSTDSMDAPVSSLAFSEFSTQLARKGDTTNNITFGCQRRDSTSTPLKEHSQNLVDFNDEIVPATQNPSLFTTSMSPIPPSFPKQFECNNGAFTLNDSVDVRRQQQTYASNEENLQSHDSAVDNVFAPHTPAYIMNPPRSPSLSRTQSLVSAHDVIEKCPANDQNQQEISAPLDENLECHGSVVDNISASHTSASSFDNIGSLAPSTPRQLTCDVDISRPILDDPSSSKPRHEYIHERKARVGFIANSTHMAIEVTMHIRSDEEVLHMGPVELMFEDQKVWKRSARAVTKEIEGKIASLSQKKLTDQTNVSKAKSPNISTAKSVTPNTSTARLVSPNVSSSNLTPSIAEKIPDESPKKIPAEAYKGPSQTFRRSSCNK